jgi:hypothetical protein
MSRSDWFNHHDGDADLNETPANCARRFGTIASPKCAIPVIENKRLMDLKVRQPRKAE